MKRIRSLLCVPGHKPHLFEKAFKHGADCIMFDLEDSTPEQHKDFALDAVATALRTYEGRPELLVVRVNPERLERELYVLEHGRLDAIVMPKVRSRECFPLVRRAIIPVIETPKAIVMLEGIVSDPRVKACIFGVADFAAGMGVSDRISVGRDTTGWDVNSRFGYAKQKLTVTCAAYEKQCLDTCFVVKGENGERYVRQHWIESASWGFTGGAAIHPMQVGVAQEVFAPRQIEREWAIKVSEDHVARAGEVGVDEHGMVVGMPVARQAAAILRKSEVKK